MAPFTDKDRRCGWLNEIYVIDQEDEFSSEYRHDIETRKEFKYSLGLFINECDNSINNAIKLANLILAEHNKNKKDYN